MKPLIAVSGKNGQLGWELARIAATHPEWDFVFFDRSGLDITNEQQVKEFFSEHKPAVFINCAAYTAVDKAEVEQEAAYAANAAAVGRLATLCQANNAILVSFSTDYVFDGRGTEPYKEDLPTAPLNYYGYTKEHGEKLALANCDRCVMIRTSWVYSCHGHNFVKTMLRLMKEREEISVVEDQLGSPTYAKDLAEATLQVIAQLLAGTSSAFGIYHYSNTGVISWFEFAAEIRRQAGLQCRVKPIPTSAFPTPAKRPAYSVLAKDKIVGVFHLQLKDWKESLADCLALISQNTPG